jgi:3-hydroxyisobutyrate dehydrogenase-like beta-hydroxyacid dehydrogenase
MGGRMARRLVDAGRDLTIFDTSKAMMQPLIERGAHPVESAAAVASACEIVFVSLPTPSIVEAVALGPQGVAEGSRVRIFIDTSTTGATAARRIADGLAKKNIVAVDSPVSGGLPGAEKGTLAVMVSCPEETLARVKPILETLGKVFFCGTKPGLGQTMKLLNNLLSATAMAITSEAVVMGAKAGLDPSLIVDVLNAGTGRNSASVDKFPKYIIPRTFNAGFAMNLFNKDIRLCLEEADSLGVPMIVGTAVRQLYSIAMASEGPSADMTEVVKSVERWAGKTVGS